MKKYIMIAMFAALGVSCGHLKKANKEFDKFAYVKSAELYEEAYDKGDSTKLVLSKLADSHYFNNNTEASAKWYKKTVCIT